MDHVGLWALDDEPDVELLVRLRELVRPLADAHDDWHLVEVRTSDGGATIMGLASGGSLSFNRVHGDEIWSLIHRACVDGRQALVLDEMHLVVATPAHVSLIPAECQQDLQVCESPASLKAAHGDFFAVLRGPIPKTEDQDRSFYRRDGSRVTGWIPGDLDILERWPRPPFDAALGSASRSQLRFATLSMVGRLFGQFLEEPGRPVPEGLAPAFEAWLSEAWQRWAVDDEDWGSLDVSRLAAFDGTFYGDEGGPVLEAFDLAARMSQPTDPSDQLGMAVMDLSSAITDPVSSSWWRQRGSKMPTAPEYPELGPFTELADTVVAQLLEQDLREGATPAGVDVVARQARCRDEHRRLVELARHLEAITFPPPSEPVNATALAKGAVPEEMWPQRWR